MTPPTQVVLISNSGPRAVQDSDQNGRLGMKDQVEVMDIRRPAGFKNITIDYFVSVEYKDLANRSPIERLADTIQAAKAQGFGAKGKFRLDPELMTHALEHQVHWFRNLAAKP